MSKLFYDHLIVFEQLEVEVKDIAETPEEKEELWKIVDELVHSRVLSLILDVLPEKHHKEFLEKFHFAPHDLRHLKFLNEKVEVDIEKKIGEEMAMLEKELLDMMGPD